MQKSDADSAPRICDKLQAFAALVADDFELIAHLHDREPSLVVIGRIAAVSVRRTARPRAVK